MAYFKISVVLQELCLYTVHVNPSHAVWYNNNRPVARDFEVGMLVLLCETGLCTRYNQNQPPPHPLPLEKRERLR